MLLFRIQKEKWLGLQFMRTDYWSLVLTLVRIRWTLPLSICCLSMKTACCLSAYIFLNCTINLKDPCVPHYLLYWLLLLIGSVNTIL